MAHDPDNPLGVQIRGNERGMHFVHPYRHVGELNQVERWKLERHPLDVADAVISRYSKEGPDAIAKVPGEQERLKWVGLYPQRQGGDAFMMRVKVPGGVLSADQAREIGVVADAFGEGPDDSAVFGNRYADITTRQTIQIHWIRIADVPRIWERFADVGLTTVQACGDSARNVSSCPVSGVDAEEVFDALPVARAISDFFTGNREYANLPRKFKMSVTGCREDCAQAEINDIGMWPARAADGTVGFNVLAGGGLSDGERMASDIDVFVRPDQAVEITRAIAQLFGELGNRESRGLARMRYLVQELGPEQFRAELAARARFELVPAGEELTTRYRGDHVGVHRQHEPGLRYVGCSVPVGRMSGIELVEAARLARTYGDGTVRLGTDQNFVLTGVPEDKVDALLGEELLQKYSPFPGPFERGVVACTGSEFCRFAVVETKERAVTVGALARLRAGRRSRRAAPRGGPSIGRGARTPGSSACTSRVARPRAPSRRSPTSVSGVMSRMWGSGSSRRSTSGWEGRSGPDSAFIDWVENARPVDDVPDALLRTVRRYQSERRDGEPFHNWARRVPNEELAATLAGLDTDHAPVANR